ncbi:peroxisomal acyl-coenzyme A oxidase 1-like [Haliotis rufescens]|uniref:peroxisomal acyl-coenzyme A oxidase 1-like n=1 Tax=Haliotis rufescens TaxID=6454 RepID=UPI00201F1654|nr:peroxisomal acyl-coenzyme A oxidase 1-like [Haliotis rufescens]
MASDTVVGNVSVAVNPDLQKERDTGTFDVRELSQLLHGGPEKLMRKRELEHLLFSDPVFQDAERAFKSKEEIYELAVQKSVKLFEWKRRYQWTEEDFETAVDLACHDLALSLHHSMFIPGIERLATDEQKAEWLPLALNFKIIGTYAQTELGHGTNLLALETTATFDPKADEFVMNTPKITSMKWWPGGLGKSSTHAIVLAQLVLRGKNYGMHPFIVQLRSLEDHTPMPGITVGDIGPKLALQNIDNGFLMMNNVRIPRTNMLMRNAKVSRDGHFSTSGSSKANYATMILIRVKILSWASSLLVQGATTSIRYSAVRRQSQLKPGGEEMQILSYQSQQYKLFPALAATFAFHFVTRTMTAVYEKAYEEIIGGNNRLLAELHSQSSCLKALLSEETCVFLETQRRSMGGHGYMLMAGGGAYLLAAKTLPTVEGENTVLYQQTARYLMKQVANALSGQQLQGSSSYLAADPEYVCPIQEVNDCRNTRILLDIYRNRAYGIVTGTARKLHADMTSGMEQHVAWNNNMIRLVRAGKVHSQYYAVECFVEGVETANVRPELRTVLHKLCCLYALYGISSNSGDFLETESVTVAQMEMLRMVEYQLLAEIRPDAVSLVDAFDMHDITLHSALGCYDGNVYERLYQSALKEPMNRTQVHPVYYKHLRGLLKGSTLSKL